MSKLTVVVVGFRRGAGISKKSGSPKPYSFAQVEYMKPANDFKSEDHDIRAYGFETRSIDCLDNAQVEAELSRLPFGQEVTLLMDANPDNPARNVVVGFEA